MSAAPSPTPNPAAVSLPEIRRARFALAGMFLANGFIMGAWATQIPLLLDRHGITETELGFLILLLGLGAIGSMMLAGRMIARLGSVRVSDIFALLMIPTLPLVVFAPNVWLLALAMILLGATFGSMDVAINANAVEVERRLGRAIMSSSHGFWSLGGFLGGTSGSWMIAHFTAQHQALAAAAVAAGIILAARRHLRGEEVVAVQPGHAAALQAGKPMLPRELGIWILGAMALFSMMPEGAVLDWAAIYLRQEQAATAFTAGLGFAFFSGAMAVMRFAGDAVRNRFGAVRTLRASGVLGGAGMLLAAQAPIPELAILGFAIAGLGIANMIPIVFSAAGNFPGHSAGSAIAVVTMVGYAGILVAPATIGWIAEHAGFRPTYSGLALLLLLVAMLAGRTAMADARQIHGSTDAPSGEPRAARQL